jgi:hypothetical protein
MHSWMLEENAMPTNVPMVCLGMVKSILQLASTIEHRDQTNNTITPTECLYAS